MQTGSASLSNPLMAVVFFLCSLLSTVLSGAVVDFDNQIIPVLTKAGCNTGACHGAAVGRGGFRLSLYGGDSEFDYRSIVQELQGRRVNLATPTASLLVRKPTESLEHGGGFRLEDDAAQLVLTWVEQGAPKIQAKQLIRLDVSPRSQVANCVGDSVTLQAIAFFSDETEVDVTAWTVFTAEDQAAVRIDSETAMAELLRRGRHLVIARYLDQVVPVEFLVPIGNQPVELASEPRFNFIDELVLARLATLQLPVAPQANAATFLRRATLDLTGRLPTLEQQRIYGANRQRQTRVQLVNELLESDAFDEYWTFRLAQLFRVSPQPNDRQGAITYHRWLKQRVSQRVAYDQVARDLLMATGDTHEIGPANFFRTVRGPREQAELASELFMGSRLRCANCHNHPLDHWTQDDYHGLAAVFAGVEQGRVIRVDSDGGEVIHPRTGEAAKPRIPGGPYLTGVDDGRVAFATWLTGPENPYFAKTVVNRLWKAMMGRGLVEPTDDFRSTNPATHPVLLDKLAADFVQNEYDLRHVIRRIALSATYGRSSSTVVTNQNDDRFYSRALSRPLSPELLADAISDVIDMPDQYGNEPLGTRAISLVDAGIASTSLDVLGRCSRQESCETTGAVVGGLTRTLHLINGPLLNRRISDPQSRLIKLVKAKEDQAGVVNRFYRLALSRNPTDDEHAYWDSQLRRNKDDAQAELKVLEDFVWSVLSCQEFMTNH
ncbi:MAG: DUF1553 domain-containing protein [Pirellulaceae bacterium]|nr:DUF1553 domain-containing protein [Pirellulaceae bacterium]